MAQANKRANTRAHKPLTQDRLKEILHYDAATGRFTWKIDVICGRGRGRPIVCAGAPAGSSTKRRYTSYVVLGIDGQRIFAHRAAFLYVTGVIPKLVDHRDCNGLNNAWHNLRAATKSQNNANARTARNNRAGVKGVMRAKHGKKWVAQIKPNRKSTHLGTFDTIEEAQAAYAAAAKALYGDFSRTK